MRQCTRRGPVPDVHGYCGTVDRRFKINMYPTISVGWTTEISSQPSAAASVASATPFVTSMLCRFRYSHCSCIRIAVPFARERIPNPPRAGSSRAAQRIEDHALDTPQTAASNACTKRATMAGVAPLLNRTSSTPCVFGRDSSGPASTCRMNALALASASSSLRPSCPNASSCLRQLRSTMSPFVLQAGGAAGHGLVNVRGRPVPLRSRDSEVIERSAEEDFI